MKVGFVVPRYGPQVIGGAELAVRLLAEHLVAQPGGTGSSEVEVFTTCALDAGTWADAVAPGTTIEHGVTVHRFRSRSGRHPQFESRSADVLERPRDTTIEASRQWVIDQGPVCPELVDAVAASSCDAVALSPYLYHPVVSGVERLGPRSVLHGAAHDEPPFHLPVYEGLYQAAGALVFYTHAERALTEQRFPTVTARPQIVLGLGCDTGEGDGPAARRAIGIDDDVPYVICLGRVDRGKGTEALARFFAAYRERNREPLRLVFVGPVVHQPTPHPDIVVTGPVDEATKWGLLRGSHALISPSGFESFSFVVLEGWSAGVPVMVNARCEATREHCQRSGAGLTFGDFATFEAALGRLLHDRPLARALADRGRSYVDAQFRWPSVVSRYLAFLTGVADRAAGARR